MLVTLKLLLRPWRVVGKARALKNTAVAMLRQLLDAQRATQDEVRELHRSGLMAAIHLLEEQARARAELAEDYARLERRLAAVEAELAAAGKRPGNTDEDTRV
jgi:phosphoglycolate phosphatase-like HAD superfamily hydrolase